MCVCVCVRVCVVSACHLSSKTQRVSVAFFPCVANSLQSRDNGPTCTRFLNPSQIIMFRFAIRLHFTNGQYYSQMAIGNYYERRALAGLEGADSEGKKDE